MSTYATTYDDPAVASAAIERDARALLGQVMGYVAVTVGYAIGLAPAEDFRGDSDLFVQSVSEPEAQGLLAGALRNGFQDREAELDLASMLGDLATQRPGPVRFSLGR